MTEVNLRSWQEISQASEGLQLNATTVTLEYILAGGAAKISGAITGCVVAEEIWATRTLGFAMSSNESTS